MVVSYTSYELILGCFRSLPEATSEIISLHLLTENHNINILIISFVAGFILFELHLRGITREALIKIVEECISNNSIWRFVCCTIHFQKYPLFIENLFKYNRISKRLFEMHSFTMFIYPRVVCCFSSETSMTEASLYDTLRVLASKNRPQAWCPIVL